MDVGIDAISFYTSRYFLDLKSLAAARGVDPNKFYIGLGQERMSVPPPDEDIVTLAANAAAPLIEQQGCDNLDTVMLATETGIDQSKAAGIYVHSLLDMPRNCRVVELKQACYSGTAALQMANAMIREKPDRRVLILASDIARYGLGARGEPTQGCGAIAMLVCADPRILAIEPRSGCYTEDVMDFWRPNYREEAVVDGHYSTKVYLAALLESWRDYAEQSGHGFGDVDRYCYHLPFTRMAEKAHALLARESSDDPPAEDVLKAQIFDSLRYNRVTGNSYAASLYEGLTSLLDTSQDDLAGCRVGLYSYGSGCVAEFLSGIVQPAYRKRLRAEPHRALLDNRKELTYEDYEAFYNFDFPSDGGLHEFPRHKTGRFRLAGVNEHKRTYERTA
jgi:hydroxymethylglutaryl-CoA synthase